MFFSDFIVMLILAAASGCGIGGGGLLIVYLTLFKGVNQTAAQAVNLLFYIISAGASAVYRIKRKSAENLRSALFCSAIAIPGVYLGSVIRNNISESYLQVIFGALLISAGLWIGISNIKKTILTTSLYGKKS